MYENSKGIRGVGGGGGGGEVNVVFVVLCRREFLWCVGSSAVHWKDCTFLLCVEWRDVNVDVFVIRKKRREEKKFLNFTP